MNMESVNPLLIDGTLSLIRRRPHQIIAAGEVAFRVTLAGTPHIFQPLDFALRCLSLLS